MNEMIESTYINPLTHIAVWPTKKTNFKEI
jgi:hypothetical protein